MFHCSFQLYVWGTLFAGQRPLKSPQTVRLSEADVVMSVEAGRCITMAMVNRKDYGPSLCRVLCEKGALVLSDIEAMVRWNCSVSCIS